jgi:hypothetical protein
LRCLLFQMLSLETISLPGFATDESTHTGYRSKRGSGIGMLGTEVHTHQTLQPRFCTHIHTFKAISREENTRVHTQVPNFESSNTRLHTRILMIWSVDSQRYLFSNDLQLR